MIFDLLTPDPKGTVFGHWSSVPFLKDKTKLEFKPGLNVIFGPNGSGKSTIVLTLAYMFHAYQSGFQKVTYDSWRRMLEGCRGVGAFGKGDLTQFANSDGGEIRFMSAEQGIGYFGMGAFDDDNFNEHLVHMQVARSSSSGQLATHKFFRICGEKPRNGPVPFQNNCKLRGVDSHSSLQERADRELLEKILRGSPPADASPVPTFLLDEPDRSLDFIRQAELWNFFRAISRSSQVIISTHCPLALALPEANYIETAPDAIRSMTEALAAVGWTRSFVPEPVMPWSPKVEPLVKKAKKSKKTS